MTQYYVHVYSSFVINIDIIGALGIICTVSGLLITIVRIASDKFGRFDERLKYLEKTTDGLEVDLKDLTKIKWKIFSKE